MSYKYIFDTFAWVELFDGTEKGKKVLLLLEEDVVATSVIVLAELSDKCRRENWNIEPFLQYIRAKAMILPLSQEIAIKSGFYKTELRKICRNISLPDAIHYTTARENNAILVTGDSDFKDVKNNVLFL